MTDVVVCYDLYYQRMVPLTLLTFAEKKHWQLAVWL